MPPKLNIYVDGSYRPTHGSNKAGIGIYFGNGDNRNCAITIYGSKLYTVDNLSAEAIGVYIALSLARYYKNLDIYSDSDHCVFSLTVRYQEFKKNGWLTAKNKPVAHRDILRECAIILEERKSKGWKSGINLVSGHSGVIGNERADKLAYQGMSGNVSGTTTNVVKLNLGSTIRNLVAKSIELRAIQLGISIGSMPNKKKLNTAQMAAANWPTFQRSEWEQQIFDTGVKAANSELVDEVHEHEHIILESPTIETVNAKQYVSDNEPEDTADNIDKQVSESPTEDVKEDVEYTRNTTIDDAIIAQDSVLQEESSIKGKDKEDKYLVFPCLQCPRGIQVRYPYSGYKKLNRELSCTSFCIIAYTTCKKCLLSIQNSPPIEDIAMQRKDSVEGAFISYHSFIGSAIYECATAISDSTPTILSQNNFIKYIPVTQINTICNDKCRASTLDIKNHRVMDYLEFGFLP